MGDVYDSGTVDTSIGLPLEVGDALSPGILAIDSGFAQIEFFCGATVIIEGPAELVVDGELIEDVQTAVTKTKAGGS